MCMYNDLDGMVTSKRGEGGGGAKSTLQVDVIAYRHTQHNSSPCFFPSLQLQYSSRSQGAQLEVLPAWTESRSYVPQTVRLHLSTINNLYSTHTFS